MTHPSSCASVPACQACFIYACEIQFEVIWKETAFHYGCDFTSFEPVPKKTPNSFVLPERNGGPFCLNEVLLDPLLIRNGAHGSVFMLVRVFEVLERGL